MFSQYLQQQQDASSPFIHRPAYQSFPIKNKENIIPERQTSQQQSTTTMSSTPTTDRNSNIFRNFTSRPSSLTKNTNALSNITLRTINMPAQPQKQQEYTKHCLSPDAISAASPTPLKFIRNAFRTFQLPKKAINKEQAQNNSNKNAVTSRTTRLIASSKHPSPIRTTTTTATATTLPSPWKSTPNSFSSTQFSSTKSLLTPLSSKNNIASQKLLPIIPQQQQNKYKVPSCPVLSALSDDDDSSDTSQLNIPFSQQSNKSAKKQISETFLNRKLPTDDYLNLQKYYKSKYEEVISTHQLKQRQFRLPLVPLRVNKPLRESESITCESKRFFGQNQNLEQTDEIMKPWDNHPDDDEVSMDQFMNTSIDRQSIKD